MCIYVNQNQTINDQVVSPTMLTKTKKSLLREKASVVSDLIMPTSNHNIQQKLINLCCIWAPSWMGCIVEKGSLVKSSLY